MGQLKPVKYVQIDDEKGALFAGGKQSVLLPATFVRTLQDTFSYLVGEESAEILTYKLGEAIAQGYVQTLKSVLCEEGVDISLDVEIRMCCNAIFMEAGWGRVRILELDLENNRMQVELCYGPSMVFLDKRNFGLERGIIAGMYSAVVGKKVYCSVVSWDDSQEKVILLASSCFPSDFEEKERMALISRRELEEKNRQIEEAYHQLQETQQQLIQSEKMATIGMLAAGVAHEINTPLGVILMNAQRLLLKCEGDSEKRALERICKSTERCKVIIEQLLRYARKSDVAYELVDLNRVVEDTVALLEHVFEDAGIKVQVNLEDISKVNGSSIELSQVLTNLLLNAKDAICRCEQREGTVVITTSQDNKSVILEIRDNGCGIPEENLSRIFDPFFTTKDIGEGTGLGLSVASRIVESHGGKIQVESKEGIGTIFRLIFPLQSYS